jgi:glycerophosphoryl diester phosphodiesterase
MARESRPAWLVARPIAHRGLHDRSQGLVENSLGAARAAIARGFAIECDVQLTGDGDAVVFHDFSLDRLTRKGGRVDGLSTAALAAIAYRDGSDRIAPLSAFLAAIDGQVPLVCEIKSRFDGDLRLADRVATLMRDYPGPVAIKSFDPAVIAHLRKDPPSPLGIVAEAAYDDPEWIELSPIRKRELAALAHFSETRPDFLSYHVDDLPHAAPLLFRAALGLPVMTWTVRRPEQRELARHWADQIVFEGFLP